VVRIRRPVIGVNAPRYIMVMSLSFGISVVITRFYLEMTGYPQIGDSTFHFAHALWGGLLLILAVLGMLVYVNRWISDLSAVLAGVGVGLFIDEVGKFITQQNNYFFPLAAPIIYVAFLLIVLVELVLRQRRRSGNMRAEMYEVLDELEEVLEADLSESERDRMVDRLQQIAAQTARPDLAALARSFLAFLESGAVTVLPDRPSRTEPFLRTLSRLEERILTRARARRLLVILFLLNALSVLVVAALLMVIGLSDNSQIPTLVQSLIASEANVVGITSLNSFLAMTLFQFLAGILLFASAIGFLTNHEKWAMNLGAVALIILLTFVNTLSFYFSQFSVLFNTLFSFLVLLGLERYRARFLSAFAQ
jgi:hypothetical protein